MKPWHVDALVLIIIAFGIVAAFLFVISIAFPKDEKPRGGSGMID